MKESATRTQITTSNPEAAVREWFALLGRYCAAVDYEGGESIFAPDTIAFGTKARVVEGLAHVRQNQWEGIWPSIRDFEIEMDQVRGYGHERWAWGVATWTSTGFDQDGKPYFRPGRATVVLERRDGRWLATHSHFSLAPGTPQQTFGPSGAKDRGDLPGQTRP
jgi:ketosteroid isomerase-like protein